MAAFRGWDRAAPGGVGQPHDPAQPGIVQSVHLARGIAGSAVIMSAGVRPDGTGVASRAEGDSAVGRGGAARARIRRETLTSRAGA